MPRLWANIDSVTVIKWHKSVGDQVAIGDVLADLDTDKAAFELEAEGAGVLRHIAVQEGEIVAYNTPLAIIAGPDDDISDAISALTEDVSSATTERIGRINESVFDDTRSTVIQQRESRIATPKAEALAAGKGLTKRDLESLARMLDRDFVTERDLEDYLALDPTYIYGASTGAKQIFSAIQSGCRFRVVGIIDDAEHKQGLTIEGIPVLGGIDALIKAAQGSNISTLIASHSHNRRKIADKILAACPEVRLPALIDRRAILLDGVTVEDAVFVEAGCVIGHEVHLKRGAIVNVGVKMSHNCTIGEFSHIAVGTSLSGNVSIGNNSLIGAGVSTGPGLAIGDNVIVTPGSSVVTDVPSDVTASGNPVKVIGTSKRGTA